MEVIERDSGFNDKINFSLRILNLDKNICDLLKLDFNEIELYEVKYNERANKFIILINDLENNTKHLQIIDIIRKHKIEREKINFFISLTTQNDISGFTVPRKVADLHFNIGGSIDFSVILSV